MDTKQKTHTHTLHVVVSTLLHAIDLYLPYIWGNKVFVHTPKVRATVPNRLWDRVPIFYQSPEQLNKLSPKVRATVSGSLPSHRENFWSFTGLRVNFADFKTWWFYWGVLLVWHVFWRPWSGEFQGDCLPCVWYRCCPDCHDITAKRPLPLIRSRPNWITGLGPKSGLAGKSGSRGPENGVSRWRRPNSDIYSQNYHFGLVYDMKYKSLKTLGMEAKNYKFGMFCQQCHPSVASGDADIRPRSASRIHTWHLFTS